MFKRCCIHLTCASIVTILCLDVAACVRAADAQPEDSLPGKVIYSWLANSFATEKDHQSVPVNVCGIGVAPDGTVYSAGVSEAFGGVASYKDGKFVTKYDYDSGWGSSSSAVVADDDYVYIGSGAGLFRTRVGDTAYNRTASSKDSFTAWRFATGSFTSAITTLGKCGCWRPRR